MLKNPPVRAPETAHDARESRAAAVPLNAEQRQRPIPAKIRFRAPIVTLGRLAAKHAGLSGLEPVCWIEPKLVGLRIDVGVLIHLSARRFDADGISDRQLIEQGAGGLEDCGGE